MPPVSFGLISLLLFGLRPGVPVASATPPPDRPPQRRGPRQGTTHTGRAEQPVTPGPSTDHAPRGHGRHLRPDPPRPPRGRQRGASRCSTSTRSCSSPRAAVAEGRPRGLAGRAPLPHDGRSRPPPTPASPSAASTSTGRARPTRSTRCATCRTQRPDAELFFITGADALAQILSWKDADELFELAHFIGVTRPGHELTDRGLPADRVSLHGGPRHGDQLHRLPRPRRAPADPVWYLVPDGVVQYIAKYHLYRGRRRPGRLRHPSRSTHHVGGRTCPPRNTPSTSPGRPPRPPTTSWPPRSSRSTSASSWR